VFGSGESEGMKSGARGEVELGFTEFVHGFEFWY
jgi:hypothetical protein